MRRLSGQKFKRIKYLRIGLGVLVEIRVLMSGTLQVYPWSCEGCHTITPIPITNTVKFFIDTNPPKKVQPALPRGTQGKEESVKH